MVVVWLFLISLVLLILHIRESFTDTEFTNVKRPDSTNNSVDVGGWKSRIEAVAPSGYNEADYIRLLQTFFDNVYQPAANKPSIADVKTFLVSSDATVDKTALETLIVNGFHIDPGVTAGQKEKDQVVFEPGTALQPENGVDEVYVRQEGGYTPTDTRIGDLPEGEYAPVEQQEVPRRTGAKDYKTTGRTGVLFHDVCEGGPCEENVL